LAGHDDALHLVGAFVDLGDLGIAHHPLDREVAGVAMPPSSWTASTVTFIATSEAKHLAAAPKNGQVAVATLGLGRRDIDQLPGRLDLPSPCRRA
jgi:hypothetical protein